MTQYEKFLWILKRSKRYEMTGEFLTLTDYHTGESVTLNLDRIDEELFSEIAVDDDEFNADQCYD